ncbi:cobalt-precorrin-6A reductase [Pseudonocardiaceae bacterium YIM PH 21723]|nr:cobalt-precorrin-6A reductase [Pseudonocardiaceae bacterium YIM PH 21723]
MRVLVLGGTRLSRQLATTLREQGIAVISSLAGRVADPLLPPGEVRIGGFGGVPGLIEWLRSHPVDAVVDATHPFAAQMSSHAHQACSVLDVPLLGLRVPSWPPGPGRAWVGSLDEAATRVAARTFLTIGSLGLPAFAARPEWFLIRSVDRPPVLPARHELVLDRGPFTVDGELRLLREHRIELLVTKDSGGPDAKLHAAAELGIPVLLIARPVLPDMPVATTVADAVRWLL